MSKRKTVIKRIFDFCSALIFIFIFSPFFLVLSLTVLVFLGRPVFFYQMRPGLNGKLFSLIKFRTMNEACDADGILLPDNNRLSFFGRFLRQTSLDEIPQIINVLKGEMSLVGPRPLLVEYLPLYSNEQARRHLVRPGITGLAQVNGRNLTSWPERLAQDVWYVDNMSLILDLKILFKTIFKVLNRDGINQSTQESMKKFQGN
jgi:lipopolysaccharide/colanic/teichoic acid biosynthesis glycosyltransferase